MDIFKRVHAFIWESMTTNNCNTYVIEGPTRMLIDPGHAALFDHVHEKLSEFGIGIEDIGLVLCTHAHPDHIEAVHIFEDEPALSTIHQAEWEIAKPYASTFGISLESVMPDFFLKEGELSVNGLQFEIIHTPGHSPGSVSIYWPEERALFTGDVVFKGALGRTDLPGGDGDLLKKSIKRLSELDVEYILPGHGEIVAGAKAVKLNFEELEQVWF